MCILPLNSLTSCPFSPLPGQDDEEDRAAHGVPGVQAAHPGAAEAGEALRVGRRQEEEGADDPVLGCIVLPLTPVMFAAFHTL